MNKARDRWLDWFAAVVLGAALITAAMRLEITNWTPNLQVIEILTLIGFIFGLALGYSRFRSSLAKIFAVYYTLFFIFWQLGLWLEENLEWPERFTNMILRLNYSIVEVSQNRPIYDAILFLTTMSLFFWIISIVAGYQLARYGKPWLPLFIAGVGLLVIDFYAPYEPTRDRYSGAFVFFSLLLAARLYLLNARRDWNEKNVVVDPELGFDLGRTVAVSGLALVLIAWNIPTMVDALTPGTELQKELARQWETVRDRLQNSVAGLKSPVVVVSEFFGNDLGLGTGGAQGDEIVFTVQLSEKRPDGARFYWRARSYDTYVNGQWRSSTEAPRTIKAGEWPFLYPEWSGRKEVNLTITPFLASIRNLYAPGVPLSYSRQADVISRMNNDGTADVLGVVADPPLRNGEIFRVKAWISRPTITALKASNEEYPADIKRTYTQLPRNFSRRVSNLARELTTGIANPYDKVMKITNYLRDNIKYSQTVPAPPTNQDTIEWFLFTTKSGFCNYYASAEVLMLRSIGIPARLTVGYAEGESEQAGSLYTIRRRDSHAWPEVYFNGVGWVEFEPTTAQPLIDLPESEVVETPPDETIDPDNQVNKPPLDDEEFDDGGDVGAGTTANQTVNYALIFAIFAGLLSLAAFLYFRFRNSFKLFNDPFPVIIEKRLQERGLSSPTWVSQWARFSKLTPMEKLFSRINLALMVLRKKIDPGATPSERMDRLVEAVPDTREPAAAMLKEYHAEEYSPQKGDYEQARIAQRTILRRTFASFFNRFKGY